MNILDKILATKRAELADITNERRLAVIEAAEAMGHPRPFRAVLHRPAGAAVRVIAEIKRASPSAGPIRPGADPAEIAREYAAGGATALSVLTDKTYFDGDLAFLGVARRSCNLPLLRKDFIIDPLQIAEARAAGADAVLLIAAAFPAGDVRLSDCVLVAAGLGLDALVEVHDEAELEQALAARANLIGVNHRDLKTFTIDMSLTERIAKKVPAGTVLVAESGIKTADDVKRLGDAGAHAVLVGEAMMRAPSPGAALRELLR
ncbi:MAG TPA: indole-3-glycerol phosphate synthase TrpC [Kofleriaceae bacterium]